jgi:hypothetical protein
MTQILQRQGDYGILAPLEWLPEQLKIIERVGRTAYQSYTCKPCNGEGYLPSDDGMVQPCPDCIPAYKCPKHQSEGKS